MKSIKPTVIVGMSGGVDSSVAALLLKEQGYSVAGAFMKNWEEEDERFCQASQDFADAQAVCDRLDIELHSINFAKEYWAAVFSYFLDEYRAGRTPNPDILCNKEIKFKVFLNYAKSLGATYLATGHYSQLLRQGAKVSLLKGKDPLKDQSYFLHALNQEQLSQSLFPVGELPKTQVRELARRAGLATHTKKDSVGICFIGERKFKTFLNEFLPAQPGEMVSAEGKGLGQHDGLMFYTLGQRQGLKIGGLKESEDCPWYVVDKDLKTNRLIVGQGNEHPLLFSKSLIAEQMHWIEGEPQLPCSLFAKTRYRQPDQACHIEKESEGRYRVHFQDAQRAVTPGQSVVFYQGETCLGGGIIVERQA